MRENRRALRGECQPCSGNIGLTSLELVEYIRQGENAFEVKADPQFLRQ